MELQCVSCGDSTILHCGSHECVWTVCFPCGWIYGPTGVIPTWERYKSQAQQKPGSPS